MTVTTVGFDGTMAEGKWAKLMRYASEVGYKHGVPTGLGVTPGDGTRKTQVATGTAVLPGLLAESDAVEVLTHAANTGSANRADYVVLRADWSTNTVVPAIVTGTSATPPALTQDEGVIWEMPLAIVTVRPAVTTILTSDIAICKPLPRVARTTKTTVAATTRNHGAPAFDVATVTFTDPGWPYRLEVTAAGRFDNAATGYAIMLLAIGGAEIGRSVSPKLSISGPQPVHLATTTEILTGPVTARLQIVPWLMSSPDDLVLTSNPMGHFTVTQTPA